MPIGSPLSSTTAMTAALLRIPASFTGLVGFKFALAAMAVGTFSLRTAAWEFAVLALGGILTP